MIFQAVFDMLNYEKAITEVIMVINEVLKLSYHIVSEYYRNNPEPFFEYIDENILWIGPAEKQLLRSRNAILKAWAKEESDLTFTMGNITEYPVPLTPKCCCVVLTFPIYTHYPDGVTQMHSQRMDFTWAERKITDDNGTTATIPRIIKLHISNGVQIDDQDFIYAVHSKNINTNQIVCSPGVRILFSSKDGLTCSYLSDSILWIEKLDHGKYSIIHTATDDIPSNKSTGYFVENYTNIFLSPHTSYLVNPLHIKNIYRFKLTLDNGETLPIPEKKYTRFKTEFADWMEKWNKRQNGEA